MKTYSVYYSDISSLDSYISQNKIYDNEALLIQVFTSLAERDAIVALQQEIVSRFPTASLIGATTDGEICNGRVSSGQTVVAFSQFEKTRLKTALIDGEKRSSFELGSSLALALDANNSDLIISFIQGLESDGEEYLKGISSVSQEVKVAGGMAGDNAIFHKTYVFDNRHVSSTAAVGVALFNPGLFINTGFSFNWMPIGKTMKITKVDKNRIYTIDGIPAYRIYEKYLGFDVAQKLPAIGIEFPLIIERNNHRIARAILAKHDDGSLSFAGDFDEGDHVNFGYGDAEMILNDSLKNRYKAIEKPVESFFIYSCMARRRFMPSLIEREIDPFQQVASTVGFFTYGEFFSYESEKELLNQTMTVVGISESGEMAKKEVKKPKIFELNEYQKSIKALSHLLDVNTAEATRELARLEKKTREVEAQRESLQRIQEIGHFGSWEIDLKTNSSIWSAESYRIYRLDPATTKPTLGTLVSSVIEEDKSDFYEALRVLRENGSIKSRTFRVKRSDGEIITVLINAKMIYNAHGEPIKIIGTTLDITEETRLKRENRELADILENSSSGVLIVELGTFRYLYANQAALEKLGYTKEEMLGFTVQDINKDITLEELKEVEEKVRAQGTAFNRTLYSRKDGSRYPVQAYAQYGMYKNRESAVIFNIDITKLVAVEKQQQQQAQILEQINDSVISTDLDDIIIHWNNGATLLHGYSSEEMMGKSIKALYSPEEFKKATKIKEEAMRFGSAGGQIDKITKTGKVIHTDVSVSILKDEFGKIIGITRYSQDITQRKRMEEKLKRQTEKLNFQAFHDPLTYLPNRILFQDRLQQSIVSAHKHHEKFGVLFIDLDNFKQINDTLGHHYGDEVLKVVSRRLSRELREGDTLSRLGGDEFTIIAHDLRSPEYAATLAQGIIDMMQKKIVIDEYTLHITLSIGISLYPKDATDKDNLLKFSDSAMYKAKELGRNTYQFYSSELTRLAFEKAKLESGIRNAIDNSEFLVYYQPQINIKSGRLEGLEALVRWNHPQEGLVLPGAFISLAEERGLIKGLDNYVLREALNDIAAWHNDGLDPGTLSLNLSIKQLEDEQFFQVLKQTIVDTGVDPKWLSFEITESQMMLDPDRSIEKLKSLSRMGIEIAIDDFGTGYSSLAYLKRLPVDKLKIDQSFIQDLPEDEEDRAIVDAIIALAKSLNLDIVAEGVERKEQFDYLLNKECDIIQGFYYSHAIPSAEIPGYIDRFYRNLK